MNLLEGHLPTQIKKIAIPASVGFFFNTLFHVIDTLFAGLISTEAIAALSMSFPLFFMIVALVQGISTGSAALLANVIGAKDQAAEKQLTAQILIFSFLCYLFVASIGIQSSNYLFRLLGAEDNYLEMAVTYMNTIYLGSFFLVMLYAANAILYAHGNTKVIRNFLVAGACLNALLDPWFLYGGFGLPAMGLWGIALATVVTMLLGFVYVFYHVIFVEKHLHFNQAKLFLPNLKTLRQIAAQSFPAALNMMAIGIGIFQVTYFISPYGKAAVAAYGIGVRIEQLTLLPAIGLTVSTLSIIGQNNGAKLFSRVEETLNVTTRYALCFAVLGFCLMSLFPEQLYRLFTDDAEVLAIGVPYLRIGALTSVAYILLSVHIATLQGMKRPLYPMCLGFLRQVFVPFTTFYLLTTVFQFGILSIWWSLFTIAWTATLITIFYTRWMISRVKSGYSYDRIC